MPFLSVLEAQAHRTFPMKWPFEPLIRGERARDAQQTALLESSSFAFWGHHDDQWCPQRGA